MAGLSWGEHDDDWYELGVDDAVGDDGDTVNDDDDAEEVGDVEVELFLCLASWRP